jgi:hypothetical protein
MGEFKGTPGPLVAHAGAVMTADKKRYVASCVIASDSSADVDEANAKLFAAAPELLAACIELMEAGVGPEWPEVASRLWDMAVSKGEAAIAKATGAA